MRFSLDDLARGLARRGVDDSSRRGLLKSELHRAAAPVKTVSAAAAEGGGKLLARPMKRRTMLAATAGAMALAASARPSTAGAVACPPGESSCSQPCDPRGGLCCPNDHLCCTYPDSPESCHFKPLGCCRPGQTCCIKNGVAGCCGCPTGQEPCGEDTCCRPGEFCNPNGPICCDEGWSACGEECCEPGAVCVDGECQSACPPETTHCGASCCDADQVCDPDEGCVGKCPPGNQRCGSRCCAEGEVCRDGACECADGRAPCNDKCCSSGQSCCNGVCCPAGQHCVDGKCSTCPAGSVDCFGKCCPENYGCNIETGECQCPTALCGGKCCGLDGDCLDPERGICCKGERVCGGTQVGGPPVTCCEPGQVCIDDQCTGCKSPLKPCLDSCCPPEATCKVFGSGTAAICECPGDTTLCGNFCCPPNQHCTSEGCKPCPSGQFGCGSTCCPSGRVCTNVGTTSRCDCPDGTEPCATGCCAKAPEELEKLPLGRAVPPARLIASKSGTVAIPMRCDGATACAGTLTLEAVNLKKPRRVLPSKVRRTALARKKFKVAAGKQSKVKVRLPRGYRKQLQALGRIRADVLVTARAANGRKVSARSRVFNVDAP